MQQAVESSQAVRNLRAIVGAVLVVSAIHYADNVVRFDRYIDPENRFGPTSWIDAAVVAISWFAFAAAMLVGLRAYERGRYSPAALGFAIGASSGLVTLLHFIEVPPSDMDWFQLAGVAVDFVGGVTMLTAAVWVAWWGPRRAAP